MLNIPPGDLYNDKKEEGKGDKDKEAEEEESDEPKEEEKVNFYTHENRWAELIVEDSRYAMVMDEPPNFNEFSHYVATLYQYKE